MMHWLQTYLANLGHLGPMASVVFILSLAVLSMFGAPLIPFALTAGALFGLVGGVAGVMVGSALGAAGGFLVSRYVARARFVRVLGNHPKFKLIDDATQREGWKIVGLLRMCPIPFGLSNYCYGLTRVPFAQYLMATVVGMIPGELVFVYMGATGRRMLDGDGAGLNQSPAVKALYGLGLVAGLLVFVVLRKIVRERLRPMEAAATATTAKVLVPIGAREPIEQLEGRESML